MFKIKNLRFLFALISLAIFISIFSFSQKAFAETVYSQLNTGTSFDTSVSPFSLKGSIFYNPAVASGTWTNAYTGGFYTLGSPLPNILQIRRISGASCAQIASSNGGFGLVLIGQNSSGTDETGLMASGGTDLGGGICQYSLSEGLTLSNTIGYKLVSVNLYFLHKAGFDVVLDGSSSNGGQSDSNGSGVADGGSGGIAFQLCVDSCDKDFILPAACFDGMQNQNETDIDFSGVCKKASDFSFDVNQNGTKDIKEADIVFDSDISLPAGEYNFNNVTVTNNATLTLAGDPSSSNSFKGVKINAVNLTVDSGSAISADYKGYGIDQGPGVTPFTSPYSHPGASYGGLGLAGLQTATYGSETEPLDLGSGGATSGGGAIRLYVSGTFINNGIVSANGNASSSGGSIYVTADNLAGNGTFSANGGNIYGSGYFQGPGGGGRIALYHQTSSTFGGVVEASRGCGSYDGFTMSCSEAGTIVQAQKNFLPSCSDGIKNQDETGIDTGGVCFVLSSEKAITSFNFQGLTPAVNGVIDDTAHTISLTVPFGTNVTVLLPTIAISAEASVSPNTNVAQDFTSPVTYIVTAEDASTQMYTVTVVAPCAEDCFSNVLFFPGIMGSRLYEEGLDCGLDVTSPGCGEQELWVSAGSSSQEKLSLNTQGKSVNSVFTKDDTQNTGELDETGIVDDVDGFNLYQSFITDLKNWKQDGTIADYDFIPYDWRLSLDDIITNAKVFSDNRLSYTGSQDFSESFILQKLEELQTTSKSGKVTIIAHSNGGLVTKALVQKLKDTNNPLYDKIDKIIFVAVPQVGTPDAMNALLHGKALAGGFVMYADRLRQLSENMPALYNSLPSAGYFTMPQIPFAPEKLVTFENNSFFYAQTTQYGENIDNQSELKNYVLGTDGRTKPAFEDTDSPNIGNADLYAQAESVHQILDAWTPSPETKVIQIAGWGEETIAGLDCKAEVVDILGHKKMSCGPRMVIDGDATVVVPSALWMPISSNVERWWVDLKSYDTIFTLERVHKDILEVSNLRDFIKKRIKNETFEPDNIIVNNASTLTSSDTRLHYTLHSPLTLGIVDAQGRYTGMDPVTHEIKQEIPGVTYTQIGEVQFLSVPAGIAYTLTLHGFADGFFSLDVDEQTGNTVTDSISFEGISSSTLTLVTMNITPTSEVETSELRIDQDGNGSVDQTYQVVGGETQATIVTPTIHGSGSLISSGGSVSTPAQVESASVPVQLAIETPKIETKEEVVNNVVVVKNSITENKTVVSKQKISMQKKKVAKKVAVATPKKVPVIAIENKPETKIKPEMLSASVVNSGASTGFWGTIKGFIYNIFH